MTPVGLLAIVIVAGQWTGITRAALGMPVYAAALDLVLVGLLGWVVFIRLRDGRRPRIRPIGVLLVAYMLLALVQVLNPNVPSPVVGLEGYRKTAFTMIGALVVYLSVDGDARQFYKWVALGSVPALVWAVRQFFMPLDLEVEIVRSAGTSLISFHSGLVLRAFAPTAGPFHLGLLATLVAVIGVGLRGRTRGRGWLALIALAGLALGLSVTRANIVAGLIAVAISSLIVHRSLPRAVAVTAPFAAAAVLAISIAVGVIPAPVPDSPLRSPLPTSSAEPEVGVDDGGLDRVEDIVEGVTNPLEDPSLQFRFGFWQSHLQAIADQPIAGYGTSSAGDGFDRLYKNSSGSKNFDPHSLYLKPALELGIPGAVIFVVLLGAIVYYALAVSRLSPLVGAVALGSVAAVMISGITGPMLDAYPVNLLFWSMVGWVMKFSDRASPEGLGAR